MKDETLLDRAVYNYVSAVKNYRYSLGDERDLNLVGYLLQQSCELTIKHFMEYNGIRYAHTHSIEDLLDDCVANNVPIQFDDSLYDFAPAISKWESKTRYIKNYVLAKKQVMKGFELIKQFLTSNGVSADELELPEVTLQDMDAF